MDSAPIDRIGLKADDNKPSAGGVIKNILVFIVLAVIIVACFYISFSIGKRLISPIKKEKIGKINIVIPEPPESVKSLQKNQPEITLTTATLPRKTFKAVPQAGQHYYKVQAGLFEHKGNARNLAQKLQEAGFSTYIKKTSQGYRVQAGAYAAQSLANKQMNAVKDKGFNAVVIYE